MSKRNSDRHDDEMSDAEFAAWLAEDGDEEDEPEDDESGLERRAPPREHFAIVPRSVIRMNMSPGAKALYAMLADCADRDGESWWPIDKLAAAMHVSEKSIRRWTSELKAKACVLVESHPPKVNRYTVQRRPTRPR